MKYPALILSTLLVWVGSAQAHFVEMTLDTNFLDPNGDKTVSLTMSFTHPFENGPLMTMVRPKHFGLYHKGTSQDLSAALHAPKGKDDLVWHLERKTPRIGDYIFHVTPQPYFEPAEGKMIVHYTKTVFSVGGGDDWDTLIGLPVEIRPLSRPYGLWTHNIFRGEVLQNGTPVPYAEIEVEYKNDAKLQAPNDSFITQVIKADANGVFAYSLPKSGWWGFAALIEDGETMNAPDGKAYPIEKGALFWVKAEDMD